MNLEKMMKESAGSGKRPAGGTGSSPAASAAAEHGRNRENGDGQAGIFRRVGVLGAGTWGMALARMLANSGHQVCVWSALEQEIDELSATRRQRNLPDMVIPDGVTFTKKISEVCEEKDIVLFAVPSPFVRTTARAAAPYLPMGQILVDVAKGIEADTLFTLSEVIEDELTKAGRRARIVALSGPTHAEEVAVDMPTTIVSASRDIEAARIVQDTFMNTCMRVYTNPDIRGVELCGALKNIIALASGALTGLGYGDNTRAALITRGMAEMTRLGRAMGCQEETFSGLAGMGDLIVTATSMHSRNNRTGILLGKGVPLDKAIEEVGMVVEGINALPAAKELSRRYQVEMPIVDAVDRVVHEGADVREAVYGLMMRDRKREW